MTLRHAPYNEYAEKKLGRIESRTELTALVTDCPAFFVAIQTRTLLAFVPANLGFSTFAPTRHG